MPKNIYKLKDGSIVPGVTTVCNLLGKGEGLMNWSHKIAYESTVELIKDLSSLYSEITIPNYDEIQRWQDVRDSAGAKGTDVHGIIADFVSGEEVVLPDDKIAQNCFTKFRKWWGKETRENRIVVTTTEESFVSEKLGFGGQPDLILDYGGHLRLCDIKTGGKSLYDKKGKWIHDDWLLQLAGYDILLRENGYKVDEYQIIWLPKDDRFDCPIRTDLRREKKIFKHLLEIYKLRREGKWQLNLVC